MENCIGLNIVDINAKLPETNKFIFNSDEIYKEGNCTFTSELNIQFLQTKIVEIINKFTNKNGKKSCIRYFIEQMYKLNIKTALYPNVSINNIELYNEFLKIISD